MHVRYIPAEKPDPTVCSCQFCFFWQPANAMERGRTLEERLYTREGECRCQFGICTRNDLEKGTRDYYENDKLELALAGLPWFYFYASPNSVTERHGIREKYIVESEALWGKEHWKEKRK
jgi:hypothetical protein